jgi:hypothetical protein
MKCRETYLDNEFRMLFRNLTYTDRTATVDPEGWVKYCKQAGASTVFMDFRSQFYANHPSALIPKDPVLGDRDLAAEFVSAAKKHGLKYCAYIPPSSVESLEHGHDDWQQRTADGGKECRNWGFWRTVFCYNTGFGKLYSDHLREVAVKYRPHGFFIDGVIYGFSACYCQTCRGLFRQETGQEMPATPAWSNPLWQTYVAWRHHQIEKVGKLIGDAVHSVDPKIAVVWNCGYSGSGWFGAESPAMAEWMDFPCSEFLPSGQWGGFQDNYTYAEDLAWHTTANRSIKYGKLSNHYSYFVPSTRKAEIVLTANLAVAFGAQGCIQEHCNHMSEYFGRFREAEPYLVGAVPAAPVALHYSSLAMRTYAQPNNFGEMGKALRDCKGVFKALLNSHVPVDIVHDEWLAGEDFSRFKTLVLPNSTHLSGKAVAALKRYVTQGGTLVASQETGLRDAMGVRGRDLLWKGSGLTFSAEIETLKAQWGEWFPDRPPLPESDISANPDQFLMFGTQAAMKHWIGEDIAINRTADGFERREILQFAGEPSAHVATRAVQVKANASWKTVLTMRFRRDKARGFETCPAVVMKTMGKGRIVYVNFQIGELAAQAAHPWWRCFIARLVELAGGAPRISVEAPTCVKATLWRQPAEKRTVLHLVNELSTTGLSHVQREDLMPVPVKVVIALPGVVDVKVAVGPRGARVRRAGKTWTVEMGAMQERAIIVCRGK